MASILALAVLVTLTIVPYPGHGQSPSDVATALARLVVRVTPLDGAVQNRATSGLILRSGEAGAAIAATTLQAVAEAERFSITDSTGRTYPGGVLHRDRVGGVAFLSVANWAGPRTVDLDERPMRAGEGVVILGFDRASGELRFVSARAADSGRVALPVAALPLGAEGGPVVSLTEQRVLGIVRSATGGVIPSSALLAGLAAVAPSPVAIQPMPSPPFQPQARSDLAVRIPRGAPIIIAYWLVVEGPDATLGIDSRRGIEIAIDDMGGRLLARPIRLIGENSGCTADGGRAAAIRLASNTQIVAAIGSSCSSEAVPGVPVLWRARIVTVSPSNTSPLLTDPNRGSDYDGYLRTSHNDQAQGILAAQFARRILSISRAATIHDGSPYADRLQSVFAETFARLGGTVTSRETVSPHDRDMRPVLTRVASGRPELLYYPVFVAAGALITRQVKEVPGLENAKLMGADGMFTPDFLRAAGPAAAGMYQSSPNLSVDGMGPNYRELQAKYQRKYGEWPVSAFHAHAYDAAMMIFAAIEKIAQEDGADNLSIDRMVLRNALYNTKDHQGMTGTLTCNQYGDCGATKMAIYQIVSVDPARWNVGINPRRIYP